MGTVAETVHVLVVSPAEEDYVSLAHVFSHSNWSLDRVLSCHEAVERIHAGPIPVILSASELPDGNWRTVLAETALHPNPPRLIVVSPSADEKFWAEVLDCGGYDVLAKPFEAGEVVRVVSLAWRQWKHEHERLSKPSGSGAGRSARRPAAGA